MKLRKVNAATGLEWVKLGIRTFVRQPLAISGLFFMFMAAVTLLSVIPILGTVIAVVLTPAINLGLMAASREATMGRFPMPSLLIGSFRGNPARARAMLILGGLYGAALLLTLGVAMVFGPDLPPPDPETGVTPEIIATILGSPGLWLAMLMYIPVSMMFWHAPALVHWHGVSPTKSLFFSLMACWTNKSALMLYLAAWMGVIMAGAMLISLVGGLLGGATALSFILYPSALFMASMFYASIYFTFRDSFETAENLETD
ncbi:BPSS1780 family membrane protein [Hydrogenophaga sp. PAMC20947]|uniref:BPSS1780 family membrane protein n=1 Tax=Hydrogenophaga sp. PAMC20947 TaxID=2565558 RepID=UPI00109DF534|nr:BPSS1780 family membrane protein [Hydrogenophaga sp. PAMC20947]QCB45926.1 hypothetical protein E5678_07795 [Hydrogenophaga sp. PAMC20947]